MKCRSRRIVIYSRYGFIGHSKGISPHVFDTVEIQAYHDIGQQNAYGRNFDRNQMYDFATLFRQSQCLINFSCAKWIISSYSLRYLDFFFQID